MKYIILFILVISILGTHIGCGKQSVTYEGKTESQWVQQLSSMGEQDKVEAIRALSHFDSPGSIDAIKGGIQSDDPDVEIEAIEVYVGKTGKGNEVVKPMTDFIAAHGAWAYTPQLTRIIGKMGTAGEELRPVLLQKQEISPNSQQKRWQDCLDAIK